MSKKKNKAAQAAPVETAPVETAPVEQPQTAAVVTEEPKPAPVYGIVMDAEELGKRTFRKGFETVLIAELKNGPGSAQMLVDRLLASGEFQRVAPKAAANRPLKPTQELLTRWVGSKVLAVASEEEAAVVRASHQTPAASTATGETPAAGEPAANEMTAAAVYEVAVESEPTAASV